VCTVWLPWYLKLQGRLGDGNRQMAAKSARLCWVMGMSMSMDKGKGKRILITMSTVIR
jgi:hypothetical protein